MLASFPASMVNQKRPDLGTPNRIKLTSSRLNLSRSARSLSKVLLPEAILDQPCLRLAAVSREMEPFEPVRVRGADPHNDWEYCCGDYGDENDFVRCHDY